MEGGQRPTCGGKKDGGVDGLVEQEGGKSGSRGRIDEVKIRGGEGDGTGKMMSGERGEEIRTMRDGGEKMEGGIKHSGAQVKWYLSSRPVPRQEIKPALRLDECTLLFAKANTLCSNTQW